jgi:arylsulfatase A-like enzyme
VATGSRPPNVVLIVLDTARADAFDPWGAPVGTTPVLADLGRRGTVVPRAVAPSCWTLPSHVSMFAGRTARELGLGLAPGGQPAGCRTRLRRHVTELLPSRLRAAGYDTRGVSANAWISKGTGFDAGFGHFHQLRSPRAKTMGTGGLLDQLRWARSCLHAHDDDGAREAQQVLASWQDGVRPDRPFFWFVNLVECHSPYLPPKPWTTSGPLDRLRMARDASRYQTYKALLEICLTDKEVPADTIERMRRAYGDSIRSLDAWLDELLSRMEAGGLLDDTVVVVTSDHGENFGEDGLYGHAYSLDERLLRVPLVAYGPDPLEWPDLVSLTWLPSLLADATGIEAHETWEPTGDVAVSIYDRTAPLDHPIIVKLDEEMHLNERGRRRFATSLTAVTDGTHKLVVHGGEHDAPTDGPLVSVTGPDEDPADDAGATRRLRAAAGPALLALARHPDVGVAPLDEPVRLTAELEDQMRLLGYLADD